jgi:hypothetical protein
MFGNANRPTAVNPVGTNGTSEAGAAYVPGRKLPLTGSTRRSGLKVENR